MTLNHETFKEWNIIVLEGNFTVSNLYLVRSEFEKLENKPRPLIAVDLLHATNVDSSAIGLLTNFSKRIEKKNGSLVVFNVRDDIEYILKLVNFEDIVRVFPSRADFEAAAVI